MHDTAKLFIVTRRDIAPGYQAAQSVHAAFEFAKVFPEVTKEWMTISNYICVLSVASETELKRVYKQAYFQMLDCIYFLEPDLNDQMTAIAIGPSPEAERLVSEYDLALKEYFEPYLYG